MRFNSSILNEDDGDGGGGGGGGCCGGGGGGGGGCGGGGDGADDDGSVKLLRRETPDVIPLDLRPPSSPDLTPVTMRCKRPYRTVFTIRTSTTYVN